MALPETEIQEIGLSLSRVTCVQWQTAQIVIRPGCEVVPRNCGSHSSLEDIVSGAFTFTACATAVADIVAYTTGTFGFVAGSGSAPGDRHHRGLCRHSRHAPQPSSTAVPSPQPMAVPSVSFSPPDSVELLPSSPGLEEGSRNAFWRGEERDWEAEARALLGDCRPCL